MLLGTSSLHCRTLMSKQLVSCYVAALAATKWLPVSRATTALPLRCPVRHIQCQVTRESLGHRPGGSPSCRDHPYPHARKASETCRFPNMMPNYPALPFPLLNIVGSRWHEARETC